MQCRHAREKLTRCHSSSSSYRRLNTKCKSTKFEIVRMLKVTTYSFCFLSFPYVTRSIYFNIQIAKSAVGENTRTTRAAICKMAAAPENLDVSAKIGPEKVFIVYSGPTPLAGKDSIGSLHGSFIISWENPCIPSIICAVAHPGSVTFQYFEFAQLGCCLGSSGHFGRGEEIRHSGGGDHL